MAEELQYTPASLGHPTARTPIQPTPGESSHDNPLYDPYQPRQGGPNEPQAFGSPGRVHEAQTSRAGFAKLTHADEEHLMDSKSNSSWDLFAGMKRLEHDYESFDTRQASEAHLAFADGDVPKNKLTRLYNYLLNVSVISRWALFIIPVLGLLWIPGILSLTAFPNARIWGVRLIWWSIWASVVWGGWWCAFALARILPKITRWTIGVVAVGTRRYIDWLAALQRYIALFLWSLGIWIAWQPLINFRQSNASASSVHAVDIIARILFGIFLCASVLLGEKFAIQLIAGKFHERSYADRIEDQKKAVAILVILYQHSTDIPGRRDTLKASHGGKGNVDPMRFFKKALKGARGVAQNTTTAFGNLASEIAGSSILQPNSPQAMVSVALGSANKTRLLARRLFYSFVKPGAEALLLSDIAPIFKDSTQARLAFALFDKDGNGDASRDEVELACMECHREQLSIANSMKDVDSAVGRLDNIFMSLYVVIAIIIIAVCVNQNFSTWLTGAGTLVLGASWLVGGSLVEVLTSIVFLFVKHPYDVGDRIVVDKDNFTVKEIRLLSTIMLDSNNTLVQAPNSILTTKFILNLRRSPIMSETFEFDVAFDTSFDQIEQLRDKMLQFVTSQSRDFLPSFDVVVVDIPDQEKMSLTADIKYKSNWQQGALKVKRRNKWICTLKQTLSDLKIYGPKGNPDASIPPKKYTLVPWDEVQSKEAQGAALRPPTARTATQGSYRLADKDAVILDDSQDVFGESEQLAMATPQPSTVRGSGPEVAGLPRHQGASRHVSGLPVEEIELGEPSRRPRM